MATSPYKMPCRCTGVRLNKCKCVLETEYPLRVNDSNIILVARPTNNPSYLHKKNSDRNIIMRILEGLYEKCAGYNLRYCPLRGYSKTDNCLRNTLRDLAVLICFLIANFVVFLTIVIKFAFDAYFTIRQSSHWVKRCLESKDEHTGQLTQLPHNYTPVTF